VALREREAASGGKNIDQNRRPTMLCQHCHQARISRPRRLCWSCYYKPGVRELYPSTSKFGRRGVGNFNGNAPLPAFPTHAIPGSAEKLAVLAERARLRQSLWHPADASCAGPPVVLAAAG
jgi:hypothetical protein